MIIIYNNAIILITKLLKTHKHKGIKMKNKLITSLVYMFLLVASTSYSDIFTDYSDALLNAEKSLLELSHENNNFSAASDYVNFSFELPTNESVKKLDGVQITNEDEGLHAGCLTLLSETRGHLVYFEMSNFDISHYNTPNLSLFGRILTDEEIEESGIQLLERTQSTEAGHTIYDSKYLANLFGPNLVLVRKIVGNDPITGRAYVFQLATLLIKPDSECKEHEQFVESFRFDFQNSL